MAMSPRDTQRWAKEMVLSAIDAHLDERADSWTWDADDHQALLKERNRVARFLAQPERRRAFASGS